MHLIQKRESRRIQKRRWRDCRLVAVTWFWQVFHLTVNAGHCFLVSCAVSHNSRGRWKMGMFEFVTRISEQLGQRLQWLVGLRGFCSAQRYEGCMVVTFNGVHQIMTQSVENREKNSEFREGTEQRRWMVILWCVFVLMVESSQHG